MYLLCYYSFIVILYIDVICVFIRNMFCNLRLIFKKLNLLYIHRYLGNGMYKNTYLKCFKLLIFEHLLTLYRRDQRQDGCGPDDSRPGTSGEPRDGRKHMMPPPTAPADLSIAGKHLIVAIMLLK